MTTYDLSRRRWYRPTLQQLEAEAWESPLLQGLLIWEFRAATLLDFKEELLAAPEPQVIAAPRELAGGLTGSLVPLRDGQPCWLQVPGVAVPALPIFTSLAALRRAVLELPGFGYDTVATVESGEEFWQGLPHDGSIELVLDPFITAEKTTRYKRVYL